MSARKASPAALLALLLLVSCLAAQSRPSVEMLRESLPRAVNGIELSLVQVIDDTYMSGHPLDDALAHLSKERGDASAVFRGDPVGRLELGAVAVNGVSGATLLDALAQAWYGAASVHASPVNVGNGGWRVRTSRGHTTVLYRRGDIAYVASSSDDALIDDALREMP